MAERTVAVKLTLRNEGFVAGLREASKQSKDFADSVQKGTEKNKKGLDTMARGFGAVGLAAGAVFAIAVKRFADFDEAMSHVQAATHETAGNMAELRDAALDAGAKTKFSATEAAGAIENLAKAGVSTKDILGGGLKGALDLAAAGSLDVGDAAEIAATAMTQFGLSGKDVPHIADLLAAAAGKAQGEVSDMAMALKQGGLVAAQMGLSIEETTGTLAAFASAGLLGSDAGTSLKTMLLKLANPSKDAAKAMEDLGIAAYDTSGNFVGIAPLAEQLKTKMSGLSQAQRDAALATIFGSDAIRAASVLYKQGAGGISEWATKVNDSGYAAETAALKTDNLKGDIERLGGALDTALIKGGSGANDALRVLTQSLDAAVTGFSELPSWVQQGATALAGIAAVAGLSAAGLIKGVQAASELKEAWTGLSRVGKGLTLAMGAVGVALFAAVAIYGAFSKRNAEAKQKADDLRATLDEQTGAITGNTKAYVANDLAQNGMAQKAKDLGLSLSTITDAALGNESALKAVTGQLDAMIEAGKTNGPVTTQAAVDLARQGQAAYALKEALFGTNKQLTEAQRVQKLAAEGSRENKTAQELTAEAVKTANEAFQQQVQSLDDMISAMHRASTAALTLSGSQIAVESAIDDAAEAAKKNGKTLDINTEKGRENRTALNGIAAAANAQTDAMLKSGKGNDAAAVTATKARAEFVKIAMQMGVKNKAAAEAMAKALIDIPNVSREAKLTANKKDLETKLAAAKKELANPNLTKERKAQLKADIKKLEDGIAEAKRQLGTVPKSKTVTITVNTIHNDRRNVITTRTGLLDPGHAGGGLIPGPPSSVDNRLIPMATGEFVIKASEVQGNLATLEAINEGRFRQTSFASSGGGGSAPNVQVQAPDVRVFIGNEEVTDRIQVVVDKNNRGLKRYVTQRGGAR